jgi:hypothetical protein
MLKIEAVGTAETITVDVVTADGKRLTMTIKGTNARGVAVNNVAGYDKQ